MKLIKKGILLLEEKKVQFLILAVIFAVFIFTRFAFLDRFPAGMHVDEYGAAYDSRCLANYGVDRYLTRMPAYLKNYGGGQSALYAYSASLIVTLFGFSVRGFRAVAGIYALIAFVCLYLLGRQVFEEKKYALIPVFLMTVMPVFFMSERWGLDCNLFLSMSIISMFFPLYKAAWSFGDTHLSANRRQKAGPAIFAADGSCGTEASPVLIITPGSSMSSARL